MLLTEMLRDVRMGESDDESFGLGGCDDGRHDATASSAWHSARPAGSGSRRCWPRRSRASQGARWWTTDSAGARAPCRRGDGRLATSVAVGGRRRRGDATRSGAGRARRSAGGPIHSRAQARFHSGHGPRALAYGRRSRRPAAGTVTFGRRAGGYGRPWWSTTATAARRCYAHLSSHRRRGGRPVEAGQAIARSGNSGRSTGAHLHFEVREAGRPVDPGVLEHDLRGTVENGAW